MLPLADFSSRSSELLRNAHNISNHPPSVHPTVARGYAVQLKVLLNRLKTDKMATSELLWMNEGGLMASIMHPLSRGTVSISSTDPFVNPLVDLQYLSHPTDLKALIDSMRYMRKVMQTSAMQELGPVEISPGPMVSTEEQIEQYLKDGSLYFFHMTGTCSMLKKELGGVVGTDLKVHGVSNLRIADASVQPLVPASHTQGTIYAVAEKVCCWVSFE
jgi:choline dehydrogenase-like flavoprotein